MGTKIVSVELSSKEKFTVESQARKHTVIIDQPVEGGGNDAGMTPLEYLFVSLGGCMVTVGVIIARQKHLPVNKIEAHIEGEIDTDVLMGKRNDIRPGFTNITVKMMIDGNLTYEEKEKFVKEIEARCPISDNLSNTTPVKFEVA